MKYLIIFTNPETGKRQAFFTPWFEPENNFNPDVDMIVIDRTRNLVTFDGYGWEDIEENHL